MPRLKLPESVVEDLVRGIAEYIAEQRKFFRAKARALTQNQLRPIESFFPADVLENVRVFRARPPQPSFYPRLRTLGVRNVPPFSDMAGITFQDVVLHVEPLDGTLLFHELVHSVQYKHLGLRGFAEKYVAVFITGGSYEEIPLERQAYELEARFCSKPKETFSVEAEVKKSIAEDSF